MPKDIKQDILDEMNVVWSPTATTASSCGLRFVFQGETLHYYHHHEMIERGWARANPVSRGDFDTDEIWLVPFLHPSLNQNQQI